MTSACAGSLASFAAADPGAGGEDDRGGVSLPFGELAAALVVGDDRLRGSRFSARPRVRFDRRNAAVFARLPVYPANDVPSAAARASTGHAAS